MMGLKYPFFLLLLFFVTHLNATNYYVAKDGNNTNPGTMEAPFLTLSRASASLIAGDTCFVRQGVYREELKITRSGLAGKPIVFMAFGEDSVLIAATDTIQGWIHDSADIYKVPASMPLGGQNMLYYNGEDMDWARWPDNTDHNQYTIDATPCLGGSASTILGSGIPSWDWTGGYVWYLGAHSGASWTRRITGFDTAEQKISFPAIDINKWPFNPHNPTVYRNHNRGRFFLFGILEALDHPGEWYFNGTDTLYFQAPANADPNAAFTEIAKRGNTINLIGSYIHIDGINAFGGRVIITGNNCVVRNGTFSHCMEMLDPLDNTNAQIGNGAIKIDGSNTIIENNTIEYGSTNGICATSAWKGSKNITVRNNYIRHFNTIGNHSGPIRAGVTGMKIIGNTIYGCGRDGIYNSGTNSEIAWNDISGCMKINNDGGVFYTVGNASSKNTEIHHNWVHDSQGPEYADGRAAGIYLDNNSKGYHVHHNVVWNVTWTAVQMNWDNWYNEIYNNSFWDVEAAMGNWLNGYELIDNRIYNNYSHRGPWIGNEFRNNIIDSNSPFTEIGVDFTPRQGTPLVDAGIVIPGTTLQVIGSAPDVGAYEFGISPWRPGVNRDEGGDTLMTLRLEFLNPYGDTVLVYPVSLDVELDATSKDGIVSTSLYLDGKLVSHDSVPPYRWNASGFPQISGMDIGPHILRAVAMDATGFSYYKEVGLEVVKISPGDTIILGHSDTTGMQPDPWTSNMVVNETRSYSNILRAEILLGMGNFKFVAQRKADPITPFLVRVNGDNAFTVLAIGTTRDSTMYNEGYNEFDFIEGNDTSVLLGPGETIAAGFMDAYPNGTGGGAGSVIPFTVSPPADEVWWTGGNSPSLAGSLIDGYPPMTDISPKTHYRRNYLFSLGFVIDSLISTSTEGRNGRIPGSGDQQGRLQVYPNPVGDAPFRIVGTHKGMSRVLIYDLYGKQVWQGIAGESSLQLSPDVLPGTGVYIIRSVCGGRTRSAIISKY